MTSAETALVAVSGLHLGFQAVVTIVVYPALASTRPQDWDVVHADHSRRIVRLVAPLYLTVAAVCLWVLATASLDARIVLALAGHAVAAAVTAAVAAPTHGRLGRQGPTSGALRRLLVADRARLAATVVAFAASLTV